MSDKGHTNRPGLPSGIKALDMRTVPLEDANSKPTIQKPITNDSQTNKWAAWGTNDDWPTKFIEKISKSGVALTGIDTNADMHYGNGLIWTKESPDPNDKSKLIKEPSTPDGWAEWIRTSNFIQTNIDIIHSLETFYIAFVEVILTKAKNKIAFSQVLDPCYCRKEKRDANGKITKIFYSPDFGVTTPTKPDEIPLFDADKPDKFDKFVLIIEYGTYGRNYYPNPNLQSVIDNGWFDIALSVPKALSSIYKNQITPRYHIHIPLETMRALYKTWDEKGEVEQLKLILEKQDAIVASLTGEENSGVSIISMYDGIKENHCIEITPIQTPMDTVKDKELPSNSIANTEILSALGIHASLGGITIPGGTGMGAGSGSDIREARKSKQANLKSQREKSLSFANVVAMIHKFDPLITPSYMDSDTSQTLDQNPTGKQNLLS